MKHHYSSRMQLIFNIISTATTYIWVKLAFLNFVMKLPERGWLQWEMEAQALWAAHPNSGQRVCSSTAAAHWCWYRSGCWEAMTCTAQGFDAPCSHSTHCFNTRCVIKSCIPKNPELEFCKETECSTTPTLFLVFSLWQFSSEDHNSLERVLKN